ncbi:sulfatase-like hydrolase/transferase [Methanocaldococcus sp. 28A]
MDNLPNVIIIIVDTMRKDFAKPLEDALTKIGFVSYNNAIAPAPWTTPSHASIFTGLYPAFHGAHETKNRKDFGVKLKKNREILSVQLLELGFETSLFSANPYIRPSFGFIGFNNFYDIISFPWLSNDDLKCIEKLKQEYNLKNKFDILKTFLFSRQCMLLIRAGLNVIITKYWPFGEKWPKDKGAKNLIKTIIKYLRFTSNKNPKYIFINLMEVHEPYFPNENDKSVENLKTNRLDPKTVQMWKQKYLEEVKYVTGRILELMKILKEHNLFDNSLIIVTSDHGQLIGEHGRIGHGTFLYDEVLRIPLLIKYPKGLNLEIIENNSKYISLTMLKPFILNLIENKSTDDSMLYSNTVFAESYGIHVNVGELLTEEEKKNIEQLEKYRIAVYYKNFKGIFNVTEWKFEEIISYNPKIEVSEDIVKHMKKEVMKFLKTATVAKVPKIKI